MAGGTVLLWSIVAVSWGQLIVSYVAMVLLYRWAARLTPSEAREVAQGMGRRFYAHGARYLLRGRWLLLVAGIAASVSLTYIEVKHPPPSGSGMGTLIALMWIPAYTSIVILGRALKRMADRIEEHLRLAQL